MGGMEENRKKKGGAVVVTIAVVVILLVLPVLYVLSSGPAMWLAGHGYISGELDYSLYTPLEWVREKSARFRHAIDWYNSLFWPEDFLPDQ